MAQLNAHWNPMSLTHDTHVQPRSELYKFYSRLMHLSEVLKEGAVPQEGQTCAGAQATRFRSSRATYLQSAKASKSASPSGSHLPLFCTGPPLPELARREPRSGRVASYTQALQHMITGPGKRVNQRILFK